MLNYDFQSINNIGTFLKDLVSVSTFPLVTHIRHCRMVNIALGLVVAMFIFVN